MKRVKSTSIAKRATPGAARAPAARRARTRAPGSAAREAPRLGVFGGTFDPPHLGHLMIAERARRQLRLAGVLFVPAADPPHKRGRAKAPFKSRVTMTRLALRGHPGFRVSTAEARRAGPSYTVETLRELKRTRPTAELVLLMGEDSLLDFPGWREPEGILALARVAVAPRPARGTGRKRTTAAARHRAATLRGALRRRLLWLTMPALPVSSSDVRARARRGESLRALVPDAVAAYVRRHRLYRRRGPVR